MSVQLYYYPLSRPCLSVMLFSKALGLPLEKKEIDILGKEQYTEEFMKMNPQHTIPFLVDGDFSVSESGAIMMYLAETYGQDETLYPKDIKERAIINQRVFFDTGTLWLRVAQCYAIPVFHMGMGVNDLIIERVNDAFTTLDAYLDGHDWTAGDDITLADYCLVTTTAAAEAFGHNLSNFENVSAWLTRCKETLTDYDEIVQKPIDVLSEAFKERLSKLEE